MVETMIPKLDGIKNGVLVCTDEEKQIFKYVPLDHIVMSNGMTLGTFFYDFETIIERFHRRLKTLEAAASTTIDLAVATAEGVSDDL